MGFQLNGFVIIDTRGASGGYVVIKDKHGATQLLLIPVRTIPGIEGECLYGDAPTLPNYFADAWKAGAFLERSQIEPGNPAISLAVNSKPGRSDQQLHIHIDWLRQDILQQLSEKNVTEKWTRITLRVDSDEYQYEATWKSGSRFDFYPFELAAKAPDLRQPIEDRTVVVIGMKAGGRPGGFIILVGESPGDGEKLQTDDHRVIAAQVGASAGTADFLEDRVIPSGIYSFESDPSRRHFRFPQTE